jgi:parvulin-like peptidyl-prolyl isomerase
VRIFHARPRDTIVTSFGAEFAAALDQLPLQTWHAIPSNDELHIVRIESRDSGSRADFDNLRSEIMQDWRDAKAQEIRTSAVRELSKKYSVRVEGSSS